MSPPPTKEHDTCSEPYPPRLAAIGGCLVALATARGRKRRHRRPDPRLGDRAEPTGSTAEQQTAGNWTGFGANSVPSAMAAAGRNAADISQPGGTNAQDYLQTTLTSADVHRPDGARPTPPAAWA